MQLWAMKLVEEISPQLRGWGEAQNEGARGLMGLQAHQKLLPGLSPSSRSLASMCIWTGSSCATSSGF